VRRDERGRRDATSASGRGRSPRGDVCANARWPRRRRPIALA